MVRTRYTGHGRDSLRCHISGPNCLQQDHDSKCRRRRVLIATTAVIATTCAIVDVMWNRLNPEPYHTSILRGDGWVEELLNGHKNRMKDSLSTRPHLFRRLERDLIQKGGLSSSRYVGTKEQLAIFLHQAVTNNSIRQAGERFQRSNETISKYGIIILYLLC